MVPKQYHQLIEKIDFYFDGECTNVDIINTIMKDINPIARFDKPLKVGDKIIFEDQIHYTFVKNTTFNGIKLPSLVILRKDSKMELIKEFGYNDYKNRLS